MKSSCIYEGRVNHARQVPVPHAFTYRLFMMYLDLDELPSVFNRYWLWSTSGTAVARFRREHHLGENNQPLGDAVRDLVEADSGKRPSGPIRLLTNLSYFGYCFNPVSFYYCFDGTGSQVEFIVAEVNNTPWGEQNCYVMDCSANPHGPWRFAPIKKMHVSPFMPMDVDYSWLLSKPAEQLAVSMTNKKDGEKIFNAAMTLGRTPITSGSLASVLLRFPFQSAKIIISIYWQALRLWLKKVPLYAHPKKEKEVVSR